MIIAFEYVTVETIKGVNTQLQYYWECISLGNGRHGTCPEWWKHIPHVGRMYGCVHFGSWRWEATWKLVFEWQVALHVL